MDLLVKNKENKENMFMFSKTKCKSKNFCGYCLQCFSSDRLLFLMEHQKICLEKNGRQSIELKRGKFKFENYF